MLPLLLLLACTPSPPADDTGSTDGGGSDGGGSDGGSDGGGVTATATFDDVVTSLRVAGRTEGFDLDGDGSPDNALWVAGAALDPFLAGVLSGGGRVLVLQLSQVDDLQADTPAELALVSAQDSDGDPSDNASGSEVFQAGAAVDDQGIALVSTTVALSAGSYQAVLLGQSTTIGSVELSTGTPIHIAGTLSATSHSGRLGLGVPAAPLVVALTAAGYADVAKVISGIADLDTDLDGTDDAISAAFDFAAVPCGLEP